MDFYGDINLLNHELQKAVMQTETNFPESPKVGRLTFVGSRVYICVSLVGGTGMNLPVWVPLTNEIDTYVHDQTSAATSWTVTHNLNTTSPLLQVYDDNNLMLIPDSVTPLNNNTMTVTFGTAISGRAVVMFGSVLQGAGVGVLEPRSYSFVRSFTSETNITISHNLGFYPIVRVFIDSTGEEILPASVVHDSIFKTTITFSGPTTATARFI